MSKFTLRAKILVNYHWKILNSSHLSVTNYINEFWWLFLKPLGVCSRFLPLRSSSAVGKAHAALRAPRPQPPPRAPPVMAPPPPPPQRVWQNWTELMMDERFLSRFFHVYFSPGDRRVLPQVGNRARYGCRAGCIPCFNFSLNFECKKPNFTN